MSEEPSDVDLALIARQQHEMMSDMRVLQDDMRVRAATVQRMDGTLSGLVNEMRATYAQMSRFDVGSASWSRANQSMTTTFATARGFRVAGKGE